MLQARACPQTQQARPQALPAGPWSSVALASWARWWPTCCWPPTARRRRRARPTWPLTSTQTASTWRESRASTSCTGTPRARRWPSRSLHADGLALHVLVLASAACRRPALAGVHACKSASPAGSGPVKARLAAQVLKAAHLEPRALAVTFTARARAVRTVEALADVWPRVCSLPVPGNDAHWLGASC